MLYPPVDANRSPHERIGQTPAYTGPVNGVGLFVRPRFLLGYLAAGIVSCVIIPCMKCGFPSFASDTKQRRPYSPGVRSRVTMFSSPLAIGVVPPTGAPGGGPSIFSIQASTSAGFLPGWSFMMTTSWDCSAVFFTRCLLYTSDAADERSSVDLG